MITELEVFRYFIKFPWIYEKFNYVLNGHNLNIQNPFIKTYWEWFEFYHKKYEKVPSWDWLWYATHTNYNLNESQKINMAECLTQMITDSSDINYDQVFGFFLEKESFLFEEEKHKASWNNYDDLLRNQKKRVEFLEAIRNPEKIDEYVDYRIQPFSPENIEAAYDNLHTAKAECISTGHPMFDYMTGGGYPFGTVNCVHGKSNGGKTLVMGDQLLACLRYSENVRVVLFALDVNVKPMLNRLNAAVGHIPLNNDYNREIFTDRLKRGIKSPSWSDRFWMIRWPRGKKTVRDMIKEIKEIEVRVQEARAQLAAIVTPDKKKK